jgi:hypothetical protein
MSLPDARCEPSAVITNPDTDAVRAQLNDWRGVSALDQMATAFVGNTDGLHPFLETHHAVLLATDSDQFAPLAKTSVRRRGVIRDCL